MTGKKPDPAVELLYDNIGHLPDPDFTTLNILPFMHESDGARALKRKVAQGIVSLFRGAGYPMDKVEASTPVVSRDIMIHCRSCSTLLLKTHVDGSGRANVPAATVLAGLAVMESDCPHTVVTPEMQRERIQNAVLAAKAEQETRGT